MAKKRLAQQRAQQRQVLFEGEMIKWATNLNRQVGTTLEQHRDAIQDAFKKLARALGR